MTRTIDLNADMGEYANAEQQAIEAALMPLVTSCSIACGGHAGNADTMRVTAQLAKRAGVGVGAHPSYPDREGFGRRSLTIDAKTLIAALRAQIATLTHILDTEGMQLQHVKPHGSLYNDVSRDEALARLVIEAAQSEAAGAALIGPPGSALEKQALAANQLFWREGFIDRQYRPDGALTPRRQPDALIKTVSARKRQALAIVRGETFAVPGGALSLSVETLCIHSDTPDAIETAIAVRSALKNAGITMTAPV